MQDLEIASLYVISIGDILEAAEANGMNFWVGVAIASGVCCVVKFMAIVCQQKLIGERLGQTIWVRRFVGVNSLSTRAIEKILTQKGRII